MVDQVLSQRETVSGNQRVGEGKRNTKRLKKWLGEIALGRSVGPDAERVTIRELVEQFFSMTTG